MQGRQLIALGGDQLLAVERGFIQGVGITVRVYRVSATGAPDVTAVASLATVTDPRSWIGKELLVDLASCPPFTRMTSSRTTALTR